MRSGNVLRITGWGWPRWVPASAPNGGLDVGALTARDPAVRRAAIDHIQTGMDVCAGLGGERIFFFFGQDGCDYPLEIDYGQAWDWLVEGLSAVVAHRRDVQVCLEYKPFEPRRHILVSNVGTTLHLVRQVTTGQLGVVLDTGHALLAGESLGESVLLLNQAERLAHVHFNDNDGKWDDDLVAGTVHLLPFVEAIYWLKRVGYAGWQSLDLYPYRENPDWAVADSIRFLRHLDRLVDDIGVDTITTWLQHEGAQAWRQISQRALGIRQD